MKIIFIASIIILAFLPALGHGYDIHEKFIMGGENGNVETSLYEIGDYYEIREILDLIILWGVEAGEGRDTPWKIFACKYLKQVVTIRYATMEINMWLTKWFYNRGER